MEKLRKIDWNMLKAFYRYGIKNKKAGRFFLAVARASSYVFFVIYALASFVLLTSQSPVILFHFGVPACALLTSLILRQIIKRPRPFLTHSTISAPYAKKESCSFPSNHAVCSCTIAFSCFYVNYWFGFIVFILSVLASISRIFTGMHYPSDVGFGFLWGGLVSFVGFSILPSLIYQLPLL